MEFLLNVCTVAGARGCFCELGLAGTLEGAHPLSQVVTHLGPGGALQYEKHLFQSCSCSRASSQNAYQKLLVCNRREVGCALHLVLATHSLPGSVPLLMFLCVLLAPIPCAIPHPSQMLAFQGPQSPVAENCGPCGLVVCFARTRPRMG